MAIELRECLCGCGKSCYGTKARKYFNDKHKAHHHRQLKKESDNNAKN